MAETAYLLRHIMLRDEVARRLADIFERKLDFRQRPLEDYVKENHRLAYRQRRFMKKWLHRASELVAEQMQGIEVMHKGNAQTANVDDVLDL